MDIIFSEKHKLRDAQTELYGGQLVYPHECPSRMEYILKRLKETGFGQIYAPDDFGINPILAIHDEDFIQFLDIEDQSVKKSKSNVKTKSKNGKKLSTKKRKKFKNGRTNCN